MGGTGGQRAAAIITRRFCLAGREAYLGFEMNIAMGTWDGLILRLAGARFRDRAHTGQRAPLDGSEPERILRRGGCARLVASDRQMMDGSGTDAEELLLRWRQGRLDERDLYVAVRAPMHQAARSGIFSITSSDPDPQDVEEAVYDAFVQLRDRDPADVFSVIGLAKVIARRRGQDIGRKVVRAREQIEGLLADPLATAAMEFHDEDVRAAEEDERVLAMAEECFEHLTGEQCDLVTKTIMGQEQLSDWALRKGRTHQAASRQRRRAIEAIKRCIASKQSKGTTGREVTP